MSTTDAGPPLAAQAEDGKACKILFVDTSHAVRQSARTFLDAAGYSVVLAADGYEALACVVHSRPDIVLADVTMPRLDGYQMCLLLKSNSDFEHIPVIMLCSRDGPFDQERAQMVGSEAHVSKPIAAQELAMALKEAHRKLSTRPPRNEGGHRRLPMKTDPA